MAPDDVAIIMAKVAVLETRWDMHEEAAIERNNNLVNLIKPSIKAFEELGKEVADIKVNCASNRAFYDEMKDKALKKETKKIWKLDKIFFVLCAIGGWATSVILYIFKK